MGVFYCIFISLFIQFAFDDIKAFLKAIEY